MPKFICPVCGKTLNEEEKRYICPMGHNFDKAKSGYVNLLMKQSSGKRHGDDKLMVKARTDFLNKGFYNALSEKVCEIVLSFGGDNLQIIDAGCGEGKYTVDLRAALDNAGRDCDISGVDISKDALAYAARRSNTIHFAVASSAALPFADGEADVLLCIFSPLIPGEFARVLRQRGKLLHVYPLERHLWELKELIYDTPYENDHVEKAVNGFSNVKNEKLKYRITLTHDEIISLFKMTPYYYKTGKADQVKADYADNLDLSVEFGISLYEKI